MGIEESLERIATALEDIADHLTHPVVRMKDADLPAQQAAEAPQVTLAREAGIPVTIVAAAESSTKAPAMTEREILMAELDKLKLPYPAKSSVKRLKEILATYGPKQAELPIAQNRRQAEELATPAAPTVKTYTQPEAKEVLMRFAAKYGMDKAMKIITGFNVKDLSGVAAAGKLNELVEVTLKAEADHGKK
jgi:hypothetical protein